MGKNVTKEKNRERRPERRYMRAWSILLLLAVGMGALFGLASFNGRVKPNRDMKWYVRAGAVEVAAPPSGGGFETAGGSGGGSGGAQTLPERTARPEPTEAPTATEAPDPTALPVATLEPAGRSRDVTITLTAVGDCTLGGQMGFSGYKAFAKCVTENGYDYFLQNVRDLFEADDLTLVNLEGPLTTSTRAAANKKYNFRGDPAFVQILSGSSVELCNLANNHSQDYGTEGLRDTAKVLEEAGIGYCGYSVAYTANIKGVRVCALGFTRWDHSADAIAKACAAAKKECDLLIVSMHWGYENKYNADSTQRKAGRAAIDAGADVVIGTHPHVFQGIECYKGKYIVYSLGNFCFGGNANPSDLRCLIFRQRFSFDPQKGIQDAGIDIIPARVSSVMTGNNFQPTVMSREDGVQLLRSVARYSKNFDLEKTLWLPGGFVSQTSEETLEEPAELTEEQKLELSQEEWEYFVGGNDA